MFKNVASRIPWDRAMALRGKRSSPLLPEYLLTSRCIIEPEAESCGGGYIPARRSSPERPLLAKRPFMRQVATTKLAVDHQIEHG
jgi:hypothetical protein